MLADIETVSKRADRAAAMVKKGEKKYALEAEAGKILLDHLNEGRPARTAPLDDDQRAAVRDWFLLTMKKVIYAANIGEEDLGKDESELPLVQPAVSYTHLEVYKRQDILSDYPNLREYITYPYARNLQYNGKIWGLPRSLYSEEQRLPGYCVLIYKDYLSRTGTVSYTPLAIVSRLGCC